MVAPTNLLTFFILGLFWTCLVNGQLFGNTNNGFGGNSGSGFGGNGGNGFGGNGGFGSLNNNNNNNGRFGSMMGGNNFGGGPSGSGNGGFGGFGGNGGNGFGSNGGFGSMNNNNNNGGFGGFGGNNFGGGQGGNGGFGGFGGNNQRGGGMTEAQREMRDIMAGLNRLTGSNGQNGQGGQGGMDPLMALLLPEHLRDALATIGSVGNNQRSQNSMGGNSGGMMSARGAQIRNANARRYFGPNSMLSRAVREIVHPNAEPSPALVNIAMGHQGPPNSRSMMMEYIPHLVNLAYHMGVRPPGVTGIPTRQQLQEHILRRGLDWMNGNNGGGNAGSSASTNTNNNQTSQNSANQRQNTTQTSSSNTASSGASASTATNNGTRSTNTANNPPARTNTAPAPAAATSQTRSNSRNTPARVAPSANTNTASRTNTASARSSGYTNQIRQNNANNAPAPNGALGLFNQPFDLSFGSQYAVTTSAPFVQTTNSMLDDLLLMQLLMPGRTNPEAGLNLGNLRLF